MVFLPSSITTKTTVQSLNVTPHVVLLTTAVNVSRKYLTISSLTDLDAAISEVPGVYDSLAQFQKYQCVIAKLNKSLSDQMIVDAQNCTAKTTVSSANAVMNQSNQTSSMVVDLLHVRSQSNVVQSLVLGMTTVNVVANVWTTMYFTTGEVPGLMNPTGVSLKCVTKTLVLSTQALSTTVPGKVNTTKLDLKVSLTLLSTVWLRNALMAVSGLIFQ